jgi:hypothetical protein
MNPGQPYSSATLLMISRAKVIPAFEFVITAAPCPVVKHAHMRARYPSLPPWTVNHAYSRLRRTSSPGEVFTVPVFRERSAPVSPQRIRARRNRVTVPPDG